MFHYLICILVDFIFTYLKFVPKMSRSTYFEKKRIILDSKWKRHYIAWVQSNNSSTISLTYYNESYQADGKWWYISGLLLQVKVLVLAKKLNLVISRKRASDYCERNCKLNSFGLIYKPHDPFCLTLYCQGAINLYIKTKIIEIKYQNYYWMKKRANIITDFLKIVKSTEAFLFMWSQENPNFKLGAFFWLTQIYLNPKQAL